MRRGYHPSVRNRMNVNAELDRLFLSFQKDRRLVGRGGGLPLTQDKLENARLSAT